MTLPASVLEAVGTVGLEPPIPGFCDDASVAPETVEQAATILAAAAKERLTVGFRGAGTHDEVGGSRTHPIGMLSRNLTEVLEWRVEDLTIAVGSGISGGELESMLNERGQTARLPTGDPLRTIGGIIAEGASGYDRLKYGPTRDRVLEVTMATGYGKVVRGGARLVKNVTGYDLPRLVTGSLGGLGFITSVCLKLWPLAPTRSVASVDDPATAYQRLFRPVAVVESDSGSYIALEGSSADISGQVAAVGARIEDGAGLPPVIREPVLVSTRVPPALVARAVSLVTKHNPDRFIAQHGVGVVDAGWNELGVAPFLELRQEVEALGGRAVLLRSGGQLAQVDPWGTPPPTLAIQQRLKHLFDPAGICNPGKLPGGL